MAQVQQVSPPLVSSGSLSTSTRSLLRLHTGQPFGIPNDHTMWYAGSATGAATCQSVVAGHEIPKGLFCNKSVVFIGPMTCLF